MSRSSQRTHRTNGPASELANLSKSTAISITELSLDEESRCDRALRHCFAVHVRTVRLKKFARRRGTWQTTPARHLFEHGTATPAMAKTRDPKQVDAANSTGNLTPPTHTDLPLDSFHVAVLAPGRDDPRMLGRFRPAHEITRVDRAASAMWHRESRGSTHHSDARYGCNLSKSSRRTLTHRSGRPPRKPIRPPKARAGPRGSTIRSRHVIAIHTVGQFNDLPYLGHAALSRRIALQNESIGQRVPPFHSPRILSYRPPSPSMGLSPLTHKTDSPEHIKPAKILYVDRISHAWFSNRFRSSPGRRTRAASHERL